jgi:hypothetical protein
MTYQRTDWDDMEDEVEEMMMTVNDKVERERDNLEENFRFYGWNKASDLKDFLELFDNTLKCYVGKSGAETVASYFNEIFKSSPYYDSVKLFTEIMSGDDFLSLVDLYEKDVNLEKIIESVKNAAETDIVNENLDIVSRVTGLFQQAHGKNYSKSLTELLLNVSSHNDTTELVNLLDFIEQSKDQKDAKSKFKLVNYLVYTFSGNIAPKKQIDSAYLERVSNVISQPEMVRTLDLCDSSIFGLEGSMFNTICALIHSDFETETTELAAKVLGMYHDTIHLSKASDQISNVTFFFKNKRILEGLSHLLEEYHDSPYSGKIFDSLNKVIKNNKKYSDEDINSLISYFALLKNCNDLSDLNEGSLGYYTEYLAYRVSDQELRENISMREVNSLHQTHSLYVEICRENLPWKKNEALDAFFDILNKKVSYGNDLNEKRAILSEWSNNVYRMILENPDGFKLMQEVNVA